MSAAGPAVFWARSHDGGRIRVAVHLVDRAGAQFRNHAVAGLGARLLRHGGPRPQRRALRQTTVRSGGGAGGAKHRAPAGGDHGLEPRAAAAGGCRGGRPARAHRRRNLPHPCGNRFHPQLPAVERRGRRIQLRRGATGRRGNDGAGVLRAGRLHSGTGGPPAQPRNPSAQDAEPHQSPGPRGRARFLRRRRHRHAQPMDGPQGQPRLQALGAQSAAARSRASLLERKGESRCA